MDKKHMRISAPRIAGTLGALLAGTALFTVSGSARQGIQIKEYEQTEYKGDYTLMVYMNGSDLEEGYGAATADLEEMTEALLSMEGSENGPPSLRVVVETGGSLSWELPQMEGREYGRFQLTGQGPQEFQSMEARNMGDPDTLTDFINYASQTFPARHYGLVLWNHGAGPIGGYGSDSYFEGDSLLLPELRQAVSTSVRGEEGFDFVSFDACLMGGLETAACLEGMTDYIIASPELEPQDGHDYSWLTVFAREGLQEEASIGKQAGEAILEAYEGFYREKGQEVPVALSLIDLSAYGDFHDAFHPFLAAIPPEKREVLFEGFGRGRQSLQSFGSQQAGGFSELVDMGDLMELCRTAPEQGPLYGEMLDAIKELVPETVASGYADQLTGLSIYLPSGANGWLAEDMGIYKTTGFCSAWQELMEDYARYLAYDQGLSWEQVESSQDGSVTLSISPEELDQVAAAYLAAFYDTGNGQDYYLLSTDSDVEIWADGRLKAVPETGYPGLKGQILCLIETMNLDSCTEYMAPILYNGRLSTMEIYFDEEHEDGEIRAITPVDTHAQGTKEVYSLKVGDRICPLYPMERMEESGEGSPSEAGSASQTSLPLEELYFKGEEIQMEAPEDLLLELVEADPEKCLYGYMLVDLRQNIYYTEFTEGE